VALLQHRYTYRHNEVLAVLNAAIVKAVAAISPDDVRRPDEGHEQLFCRAGEAPAAPVKRNPRASIIQTAADWAVSCDLPGQQYFFPLAAAATAKRPDVVLCSASTNQLVLVELTVPNEVNIAAAQQRKASRYSELVAECSQRYNTTLLTVEVGLRGHIATQTGAVLRRLGVWSRALSVDLSYAIYVHRNDKQWSWDAPVSGV
jgi:hypothetical protein